MKFLLDAQLPPSLKQLFIEKGYDCNHTFYLELGNDTPDKKINEISVSEQRMLEIKKCDIELISIIHPHHQMIKQVCL